MSETKQKILDVAERLFGEQGYAGTSLRHIIAEAGVNLAAIHYHFGSKDELLDEVVRRNAEPVNAERVALLDRFEREAGDGPLRVEHVLDAFVTPALVTADRNPELVKLMGRLHAEGLMPALAAKHFQPMINRFQAAFKRALPDMSPEELAWKLHFMIGAMAHTACGAPGGVAEAGKEAPLKVAGRLVAFLTGGFQTPAAQPEVVEEKR